MGRAISPGLTVIRFNPPDDPAVAFVQNDLNLLTSTDVVAAAHDVHAVAIDASTDVGTHPAVLVVVSMALTLVPTHPAGRHTRLKLTPHQVPGRFRLAPEDLAGGHADICTVKAQPDATLEPLHLVRIKAGIGAGSAASTLVPAPPNCAPPIRTKRTYRGNGHSPVFNSVSWSAPARPHTRPIVGTAQTSDESVIVSNRQTPVVVIPGC
jgi:hypothetical protein